MRRIGLLILLSLLLASCGASDESGNEPNVNDQGDFEVKSLSFDVDVKAKDNVAVFEINLSNDSEKPVQLTFSSGQQYEIVINESSGEKVYKFSEGRMFTQAIIEEEIAAGDELSFEQEWDYTSDGKRVESGEYEATVKITAQTVNGEKVEPDAFVQKVSVSVPESSDENRSEKEKESKEDNQEKDSSESAEPNRIEHDNIRNIVVQGEQGNYTIKGETNLDSEIAYSVEDGHYILVEEQRVELQGDEKWQPFEISTEIKKENLPHAGVLTLVFSWEQAGEKKYHSILLEGFNN
ncbi:BsuPI-related putative proteinase inhibitor [Allobacillus sp. GCM10007491]|uniref:Intracellular proteinase inhibitor BsuPI domain-containing protein n=2 Tax=Allobacillus TaxID=1400133 RepID=A0A941CXV2_9BACI|nr:BsuPI-related putative proteinase inhibitor [Allobacillus salarius]MBR7554600.1 hypothetical protein [Allobacillus saliphilus]TSJ65541.1 hypothetical protein FPQ13_06975 [Allobacillus salarius]